MQIGTLRAQWGCAVNPWVKEYEGKVPGLPGEIRLCHTYTTKRDREEYYETDSLRALRPVRTDMHAEIPFR